MSTQLPPSRDLSPDDALPPVEPPSAGFILQLFFIPGMIVLVIVMIWLLCSIGWRTRGTIATRWSRRSRATTRPAGKRRSTWPTICAPNAGRNPRLTIDGQFATDLAAILDREIDGASTDEHSITLRIYLCRALGEFRVPDGLPVLVKAADTQRSDAEGDVRRAALEGIAFLANNLGAGDPHIADNAQLREVLLKAAADSDPRMRSAAAVAMGVVGSPELLEKLRYMLDDSNPDVRYNAATRLAHHGDVAAVPLLAEMLDPSETAGVNQEKRRRCGR